MDNLKIKIADKINMLFFHILKKVDGLNTYRCILRGSNGQ